TEEDTLLTFAASDLSVNDSKGGGADDNGQTLTVVSVSATSAQGGTVILANGQLTYTPPSNFSGADSFTYVVQDNGTTTGVADPKSAIGTVTVTVTPVNDGPVAQAYSTKTPEDTSVAITLPASDVETAPAQLTYT